MPHALLARFDECMRTFVHKGLCECMNLVDEPYMSMFFLDSCMFVWNVVLQELAALPEPTIVHVLEFECDDT